MKLIYLLILCFSLSSCEPVFAQPNFEKLADAIHLTENGRQEKGEAYGIHSVHYKDEAEARAICIRTCKHKYEEWKKKNGTFLDYLSRRYCPKNHAIWLKNVTYFMEVSNA